MAAEAQRSELSGSPVRGSRALGHPLHGFGAERRRRDAPPARPLLTPESFQEELAVLGLSGKRFGAEEYSEALEDHLGISVRIHVVPDIWYPEVSRRLASSGRLAELHYSEDLRLAVIIAPGSLPPLVLALAILHELGHLAAGDHLIEPGAADRGGAMEETYTTCRIRRGKMLARELPLADENLREREASLRAAYALVAGCLGSESPYAIRMNDVL